MSRVKHEHYDPCADPNARHPGCARPQLERLRFWNGRFLVARDLRDQQEDLIRRLEYHQSFAHGEGVLCGFEIRQHPRETCRDHYLVVESGMAYDCCGHTLWMPDCRVVEIPDSEPRQPPRVQLPDQQLTHEFDKERVENIIRTGERSASATSVQRPPLSDEAALEQWLKEHPREVPPEVPPAPVEDMHVPDPEWFVVACHVECPTDPTPALYSDDLCEPLREEHGRMRDDVALRVVPATEISDACWPRYRPVDQVDCSQVVEDDCAEHLGDAPPCFHECACGECVVLAGVWRDEAGELHWSTVHRKLLAPPVNLTRITGVSWPHGGEMTAEHLLKAQGGQLVVRFSRRLRPADGMKNGINAMTFTVSFLGAAGHYEQIIPPEDDELEPGERPVPRLSDNGRCAIFELDQRMLRGHISYGGAYILIRILCDFLIDCHGRAVSGAHIAGNVMGRGSGNGVPGGVFESWFYLSSAGQGGMAS